MYPASWYSLENLGYRLQCMKCLERFDVPSHSPDDLKWSYRSFGPFSLPAYAQGAYSVLLTFYFFSRKLEGATTPIMSFNATKRQVQLEADLGYSSINTYLGEQRQTCFLWNASHTDVSNKRTWINCVFSGRSSRCHTGVRDVARKPDIC